MCTSSSGAQELHGITTARFHRSIDQGYEIEVTDTFQTRIGDSRGKRCRIECRRRNPGRGETARDVPQASN